MGRMILGGNSYGSYMNSLFAEAEARVYDQYGDRVSVTAKKKILTKFGQNDTVGNTFETLAQFQGTVANETYVSTNAIDRVVSSSGSDTMVIVYEGHTIDGSGNLTFFSDEVTLTGQTPATLPTACARANRAYVKSSGTFNSPQALPVGEICFYNSATSTVTSGVPNTPSSTKLVIRATQSQSQKCASSISSTDYYFVRSFEAAIGAAGGSANRVQVLVEFRDIANGGVWRPRGREISLNVNENGVRVELEPLLIIPKNHDFRMVAKTNANTASVFGEVDGWLAKII